MSCTNSIVIKAPVDAVWALLRQFHDLSWATGVVESLEVVGDVADGEAGARRLLNGAIHETLLSVDDATRTLRYQITDGPGPIAKDKVSNYVGKIEVFPVTTDGTTFVFWTSSWENGSAEVSGFCNPIYHALLMALEKQFA